LDSVSVKKIFKEKPEGRRHGRPRKRYLDNVEDDLEQLGVRGWRRKASEREKNGQKSFWRQRPSKGCERHRVVVVLCSLHSPIQNRNDARSSGNM
jgi:hypothetical protein